ncbi:MAG: sulfatase [Planctomycetota bacterium]
MNLLWIMTDQHRADCMGFMSHPAIRTPNLDRLAAEGVVFENAFCQSPVCMASRASVMTGRYPATVRVRGMGILPPQETTLPEWLQRHGYRTGAFGKVHLTPEQFTRHQLDSDVPILDWRRFAELSHLAPIPDDPFKTNYGFEVHVGCDDMNQGNFHAWLRREAPHLADRPRPQPWREDGPGDLWVSPYPAEYHPTTYIARRAERFIRERTGEAPWMTFCSFVAPHHPLEAPEEVIARYDDQSIPLPWMESDVDGAFIPPAIAAAIGEMDRYSEDVARRIVLHYLASISLVDDGVGRLVDALRDRGQWDETLIVFVADHGEFLGNHGLLRKPSLHFDDLLRVPLLMRGPGLTPRRAAGLVELVDLYPTVLSLLGLDVNPGVQGADWSEPLRAGRPFGREDIYADMFDMAPVVGGTNHGAYGACQTLRTDRWKLNLFPTAGPQYGMLFDLASDPTESRNLYHDDACAAIREQLLWRLAARCHQQADPLPLRLTQY